MIKLSENESSVDITNQFEKLLGVWELRWSSSSSPVLNYSPLLDNFQILDPEKNKEFIPSFTKKILKQVSTLF